MSRITELKIIQEYTNNSKTFGLYYFKFKDDYVLVTRNNDQFKALIHYFDHDELGCINKDVTEELIQKIQNVKDDCKFNFK